MDNSHDSLKNDNISNEIERFPLKLKWVFGHQPRVPPVNLSTESERKLFFASGSIVVCYDWIKNMQIILLGHKRDIISIAATSDKKYLVSADTGPESSLIIWHANTGEIYFIISEYFPVEGIIWISFSPDDNLLMTLTGGEPQELSFWDWKSRKSVPEFIYHYAKGAEFQHYASFHPTDVSHFATCSRNNVYFFHKDGDLISSVLDMCNLYDEKTLHQAGEFSQTVFMTTSSLAVTATTSGRIILWDRPMYSKCSAANHLKERLLLDPRQRVCIRMLQIMSPQCAIPFLGISGSYIIAGTAEGKIHYYDETFHVKWSLDAREGSVNSVSFNFKQDLVRKITALQIRAGSEAKNKVLEEKDFILCTTEGYVGYFSTENKILKPVLYGTPHTVKTIAVHPWQPFFYIGDYNGGLQKWNYKTKKLVAKDLFKAKCTEVECLVIDGNGTYVACVMSHGNVAIFNAVNFSAQPFFTASEVLHRPVMMKFSPDSQHLLIIDSASYVTSYRLQLLVPPKIFQMMRRKVAMPPEEAIWVFGGKTQQHQGRVVDCMFSGLETDENLYFFTLGEDRVLVQYNLSSSKALEIVVSERIRLEGKPVPICMSWYPLFGLSHLIAVISDDSKLRIYNIEDENMIRMVSLPLYEESIKRLILLEGVTNIEDYCTATAEGSSYRCFVFQTTHMIGLTKYPIDGNPNTSLAVASHSNGICTVIPNKEETFLFSAGIVDSWIYLYEINKIALQEAEKQGGEGIDAFKCLFPLNEDPEEMKKRLLYSAYALELEMKMLKLGADNEPVLKGEVPVHFLSYIMSALGCFLSEKELQMMHKDVNFENKYLHNGQKTTLNVLEIMKLYVNYRPQEPLTKEKVSQAFKDVVALEPDPDKVTRARFLDIITTRGDTMSQDEFLTILKCLKGVKSDQLHSERTDHLNTNRITDANQIFLREEKVDQTISEEDAQTKSVLENLIPDVITEEVFLNDILCLGTSKEDLSKYILTKEDRKLVPDPPTFNDFLNVVKECMSL